MKGVSGSGARKAGRWIAIEIDRTQAIGRSEIVEQQKAEGGMVGVQQQYRVQEREKCKRVRGKRNE